MNDSPFQGSSAVKRSIVPHQVHGLIHAEIFTPCLFTHRFSATRRKENRQEKVNVRAAPLIDVAVSGQFEAGTVTDASVLSPRNEPALFPASLFIYDIRRFHLCRQALWRPKL